MEPPTHNPACGASTPLNDLERHSYRAQSVMRLATDVYEHVGNDVKVKVTLGIGILRIRTHVHHVIDRDAQTMTWNLDPSKPSDLQGNRGFWVVEPQSPTSCIVYYSVNIQTHKWAPGWLDRYIAREGFPRALGWVKREAEARFADDA